jgi:hypothetical protein
MIESAMEHRISALGVFVNEEVAFDKLQNFRASDAFHDFKVNCGHAQ